MERIKPSDLENAELKRAMRGYDMVEVHKLLQKAAQEIATLNYEIRQLKAENEKLNPLQEQASTLTDVIVMAQKTADEKAHKAQREADKIVAAARREADHILADAHEKCGDIEKQHKARLNDLQWQIERTAVEKDKIVGTYRSFLTEQLESIENTARKYVTLAVVQGSYLDTETDEDEFETEVEFTTNIDDSEFEYEYDTAVEA
ncbi:MAG TPA: DivIVA domain-containing protein [Fimbriimonadaceae bacterium]|nr:DivIVA domain-containing protein [Fimbriimonadaceae bacterium]